VIGGIGVAIVVLLILVAIGVQMYYETMFEKQTFDRVLSQDNWQLQDLRKKETAELTTYGYLDHTKSAVRIPIDQAMRLTVQEAKENRLKYPTNPYPVKTAAQLAGNATGASPQGAAAANNAQNQGVTSSPHAQQSSVPQQPTK
jgi:hypothetical protein